MTSWTFQVNDNVILEFGIEKCMNSSSLEFFLLKDHILTILNQRISSCPYPHTFIYNR